MKVLGIDTETTGLESTDRIIEVGAVVFDGSSWEPEEQHSWLVWDNTYPSSSKLAQKAHKITLKELKENGERFETVFSRLNSLAKKCDFIIAHKAEFDKSMFINQVAAQMPSHTETGCVVKYTLLEKPWICTRSDIDHKVRSHCRHLSHLALEYGIAVDPSKLHRALQDVLLMGKVMQKINVPAKYIFQNYIEATNEIEVFTKKPWIDGGIERDRVKNIGGYKWDTSTNSWKKIVRGNASLIIDERKLNGLQYTTRKL